MATGGAAALLTLLGNLDEPAQLPEDEPHFTVQLQRLDQKIDRCSISSANG